jgi:hypothetical protein
LTDLPDRASADEVGRAAVRLASHGVILGRRCSAGTWTPAVPDGWSWAVLGPRGQCLVLCHDSFEAARYFLDVESGRLEVDPEFAPLRLQADDEIEAWRRWEAWAYEYRFNRAWGRSNYEPDPPPRRRAQGGG